ncbi:hypothetical protein BKA70DRAFT_1266404 [Coprinopsis sp. MPI-PUGE-AT-0042]|nr:hypothetical protein BKA70DRAFT_1266404 [Coprinopsis sp. MPI-PUGE-AT-0042]
MRLCPFPFPKHKKQSTFKGGLDDIVLLVMGDLGAGKTTFIKEYTKSEEVVPCHRLTNDAQEVTGYEARAPQEFADQMKDRRLILVDTPGFDGLLTELAIIPKISAWFARSYENIIPPTGIIYMHSILDKRAPEDPSKVTRVLSAKPWDEYSCQAIMVTSQWDEAQKQDGPGRERQLKANYWAEDTKTMRNQLNSPAHQEAIVNEFLGTLITRRGVIKPPHSQKLQKNNNSPISRLWSRIRNALRMA